MDKTTKNNKEDLEAWLLGFEQHIGRSCVVSLLIQDGQIHFLACMDKNRYLEDTEETEETEPNLDLNKQKNYSFKDYIG